METSEDYEDLQSFLEIEDEDMKEITLSNKMKRKQKRGKIWIRKGHAAKGCKNDYDTYVGSNAFNRVM